MIKTLYPYTKRFQKYAVLTPICVIGEVLLEITIPLLMSRIVDVGIPARDVGYIVRLDLGMTLLAVSGMLLGALSSRFAALASMGFGCEVRKAAFHNVQRFSFSNLDKFSTASLVTRLTTDVTNTQNAYQLVIRMLVRAPVMLVSATLMAFSINDSLVSVFLVAIPVLGTAIFCLTRWAHPKFIAMLHRYDDLNASVQENLIAIRVVKAFVRADYEKEKFKKSNDELMQSSIAAERIIITMMPIMQLVVYSCILAILWFGGQMIIGGRMLSGELISFINYVTQILMSLMMIGMAFTQLVMARASMQRLAEVIEEQPEIAGAPAGSGPELEDGSGEFKHVDFKYNRQSDAETLKDICLSIRSGETVGILGGTGSAKSSLVQLIPRLYDICGGELLVGGHPVQEYELEVLRRGVAMVLQKNVLFSGSIRDNLRWGNNSATDEEIIAACRAASAHDFITSFPDGYDTDLGQGGVNVSGGQKQRLCIARALLAKPKILILDDSTSAVDTATDAAIRAALKTSLAGATKIIIAQRAASVCEADKIVVMEDGQIHAVGTHDELMKSCEIYRQVYQSQQKGVA